MPHPALLPRLAAAVAVAGIAGLVAGRVARARAHPPDSAPGRTARRFRFGQHVVSGRSVTVNAPPEELFRLWRELETLSRLLGHVEDARQIGPDRWAWTLVGPAGNRARVEVKITEDRPGEVLAWQSTGESEVEAQGKIAFAADPAGRGTRVEATVAHVPPFGRPGHWVARLAGRDPGTLARHALKRMKMLAETGEIATAARRREA